MHGEKVNLHDIVLRSRAGKGPCQGTFCGIRIISYLFDTGELGAEKCIDDLIGFARNRWRGLCPILWGQQLKLAELLEAMECCLIGLELYE
jgi:glycerol-3-phosphate dehydrogenase